MAGVRSVILSMLVGGVSGVIVGGGLGRVAMRLLALTSPEIAQGRLTDDGARVGQFTMSGSISLAIGLGVAGAILGASYPLVRRILPARRAGRVAGFTLLTGVVGGAVLVHDHPSFDYTVLQPPWLAVALFVLVPASWGAVTSGGVELLSTPDRPRSTGRVATVWRSTIVTAIGRATYGVLVAWGLYGLGTDIWSLATDHTSRAPFSL